MGMIKAVWRFMQRKVDLRYVWPACCEGAPTIEQARTAFGEYMAHSPYWRDFTPKEQFQILRMLKDPR